MEKAVKVSVNVEVEGCKETRETVWLFATDKLQGLREGDLNGWAFNFEMFMVNALNEIGQCQKAEEQIMDKLGVDCDKAREILAIVQREEG